MGSQSRLADVPVDERVVLLPEEMRQAEKRGRIWRACSAWEYRSITWSLKRIFRKFQHAWISLWMLYWGLAVVGIPEDSSAPCCSI